MDKITITAKVNGPYVITGDVTVIDAKGVRHESNGTSFHLCRCGCSKNKPFCDGSHRSCGFTDPEV